MAIPKRARCTVLCTGTVGTLCVIAGVLTLCFMDKFLHQQIASKIPLTKKGEFYGEWKNMTPMYFQVWVFDIVNHLEILNGERPAVIQKGPYTYKELRPKHDIKFYDNGTVYYKERREYIFDREMSVGSENDTFTTINLSMATIMTILRYEYRLLNDAVDGVFKTLDETLFTKMTVHEMLWGYEDKLLKAVSDLLKEYFNTTLPISDKVGLLMGQNNTDSGEYLIDSGAKSLDKFANLISWNRQTKLSFWTSDFANTVNGSIGILFPPFIEKSRRLYIFSPDLTRTIPLDYRRKTHVRGIPAYHFSVPLTTFANASVNPDNAGFCTPKNHCLPSGLLNVTGSHFGAPIVMSNPHFLACDKDIIDSVEGLNPDPVAHNSFLNVEPWTGLTLQGAKRLQINIYLQNIEGFTETYNLKPMFLPLMWVNESAIIPEAKAADFKHRVTTVINVAIGVKYGILALGGLFLVIAMSVFTHYRLKRAQADEDGNIQRVNTARQTIRAKYKLKGASERDDDDDDPLLLYRNNAETN